MTITIGGTAVETLDRPASAVLIALHAAHHGPGWNRARTDLERACVVLDAGLLGRDSWRGSRELRADAAMGIGPGTDHRGTRSGARARTYRTKLDSLAYRARWSGVRTMERTRRRR